LPLGHFTDPHPLYCRWSAERRVPLNKNPHHHTQIKYIHVKPLARSAHARSHQSYSGGSFLCRREGGGETAATSERPWSYSTQLPLLSPLSCGADATSTIGARHEMQQCNIIIQGKSQEWLPEAVNDNRFDSRCLSFECILILSRSSSSFLQDVERTQV
jgi:hypothetical protein